MMTNSSEVVGWIATVASKSALVAPILMGQRILESSHPLRNQVREVQQLFVSTGGDEFEARFLTMVCNG